MGFYAEKGQYGPRQLVEENESGESKYFAGGVIEAAPEGRYKLKILRPPVFAGRIVNRGRFHQLNIQELPDPVIAFSRGEYEQIMNKIVTDFGFPTKRIW